MLFASALVLQYPISWLSDHDRRILIFDCPARAALPISGSLVGYGR
jgi:hypothetical protein